MERVWRAGRWWRGGDDGEAVGRLDRASVRHGVLNVWGGLWD